MDIQLMKQEMQDVVKNNILRFWLDKMVDREHGGFYGRIDGSEVLHPEAEKGAILNARILWSFSAAYRILGNPEYLEAATRAKDYIIDHFLDKEYGGVYWSVDYLGNPLDTKKLRSMPLILNTMAILRLAHVNGVRLPICASLSSMQTTLSRRTPICISLNHTPTFIAV